MAFRQTCWRIRLMNTCSRAEVAHAAANWRVATKPGIDERNLDYVAGRPSQPWAVSSTAKWGPILRLAAVLTLIGAGFCGPLSMSAASIVGRPGPGVAVLEALTPPSVCRSAGANGPAVNSGRVITESRHLRMVPPGPTGCLWRGRSGSPIAAGYYGVPTPSQSEPRDRSGSSESGCRGPPNATVAL